MNTVQLIGRLATDIRVDHYGSKTKASCLLAVRRIGNRERADFLRIETWGKLAETFARYCAKGSRVSIKGSVKGDWINRDGGTRGGELRQSIRAEQIEFLSSRPAAERGPDDDPDSDSDGLRVVKGGRR